MNSNCIFCKIVAGDLPAAKIYEDEAVLAFMNLRPVTKGHCLVIPKQHSDNLSDTTPDNLNKVMAVTQRVAIAITKTLGTDSFTVSTNRGEHSGRTVEHLHWHIIPRYPKDGLQVWEAEAKEDAPLNTRQEIAAAIKKNL